MKAAFSKSLIVGNDKLTYPIIKKSYKYEMHYYETTLSINNKIIMEGFDSYDNANTWIKTQIKNILKNGVIYESY